jgi:hypothetical protein
VTRTIVCCIAALSFAAPQTVANAQDPDLADLLHKAEDYVARYLGIFSNVVADEHFVQDLQFSGLQAASRSRHRELRAELALIAVDPPFGWRPFRDVYEVDGKPVRDRQARLHALFTGGAGRADALSEAIKIAQESARYNLGMVYRTINIPGIPLLFLQESLRQRFEFSLDRAERDMAGTWIVKFTERTRPTLFKGERNTDNPSLGRLWIQTDTGLVQRTEHVLSQLSARATFITEFRRSERFDIAVPVKFVEESISFVQGSLSPTSRLLGTATYSDFKAFSVSTAVAPSEPPPAVPR